MAAVTPYSRYSSLQHLTASELTSKKFEVLQTLFPINSEGGPKVAAFMITSSAGSFTLLLASALSFVELRNSCDTLREVCPVIFEHGSRSCTLELLQAILNHGASIPGSPSLIALQINLDIRNCISKCLYPSYSGPNPEFELIRLMSRETNEVYIGPYWITRMENSWQPPVARPNWQGMAFEQSDRVIYTWLHEANPNALQSAREDAQRQIDRTQEEVVRKQNEIQRYTDAGRYNGVLKDRLDRELADIQQTLREHQYRLNYLTAQTVNSARQTTLQCAITMQIDQEDKIRRLEHSVCQKIVSVIDSALDKVSWEDLQIGIDAIENFIRQKMRSLEERLPMLAERSAQSEVKWDDSEDFGPVLTLDRNGPLTDWEHFRDEVMPDRQSWMRQTFAQFCQEKVGHPNPTPEEQLELDRAWKNELSKKLKWVTANLRRTDEDLKISEHYAFTDLDIRIFDRHRDQMLQVLRRGEQMTYSLARELNEWYQERDLIRRAIQNHQWIHLVKRIATSGDVYYGVIRPPVNLQERPDPSSDLNEVHIPVHNIPNLARQLQVQNRRQPQPSPASRTYKWVVGVATLVAGIALFAHRYLRTGTS